MNPNVTLTEALIRFVVVMFLAIFSVYVDMFVFMLMAMAVLVTALAQYCPLNDILGRNKHLSH